MIPVFAYGTLRDAQFLRALFDRVPKRAPATLPGWSVVIAESGYFSVVPDDAHAVTGTLVALDDRELEIADRWEEVPLYERRIVAAIDAAGAPVTAWLYVRPTESRTPPAADELSLHGREHVLQTIRAFRAASCAPSN